MRGPPTKFAPESDTNAPPAMKVFLSYSRADMAFIDGLQEALAQHGIKVHVDRQDIEKGEEWWARIKELITQADTIIFALSPDSVQSEVCQKEVDFAESLNKRFVPIVVRSVDGLDVPDALARLNYIFFLAEPRLGVSGDFDAAVAELVRALETNIGWIREHTRLGALAGRWEDHGRPSDLVLRGDDLTRAEDWLTSRPPKAPSPSDRHRAFITESRRAATRRQRLMLSAATIALVVALGLAGFATWQRSIAIENETRATRERDRALIGQSLFLTKTAAEKLEQGDALGAVLLNLAALPDAESGVTRPLVPEAEAGLHLAVSKGGVAQAIVGVQRDVALQFSPDSHYLLTMAGPSAFFGDLAARVWNLETGAAELVISGKVVKALFTPDQSAIVSLLQDGRFVVRSWPGGSEKQDFKAFENKPDEFAISPDGKLVAGAGYAGLLGLWQLSDGHEVASTTAHDGKNIAKVIFSPDGSHLATAGWNGKATIWKLPGLNPVAQLTGHDEMVSDVIYSADSRRLVTFSNSHARLWNAETGEKIADLGAPPEAGSSGKVSKVWFTSDGSAPVFVTAGRWEGTKAWDAETGTLRKVLSKGSAVVSFRNRELYSESSVLDFDDGKTVVRSLPFSENQQDIKKLHLSPDHSKLIVEGSDRGLLIHDLKVEKPDSFEASTGYLGGAGRSYFNRDGTAVATHVSRSGSASLWATGKTNPVRVFNEDRNRVRQVIFSPSGNRLIVAFANGEVLAVDVRTGKTLWRTKPGRSAPQIAFRDDGLRIYAVYIDGSFKVLDGSSGRVREEHPSLGEQTYDLSNFVGVTAVASSAKGDLAVARERGETVIWREIENKPIAQIGGHSTWAGLTKTRSGIKLLVYSPNGRLLVSAGTDHTAKVWNADTYGLNHTLSAHEQEVKHVAFSNDGRKILTVADDKTARIWAADTGRLLVTIRDADCPINHAALSPDGKRVAALCELAYSFTLWDTGTGAKWGEVTLRDNFHDTLVFHPRGDFIVVSGRGREVVPYFVSTQGVVASAKSMAGRCLTRSERDQLGLGPEPRRWCITGARLEREKDSDKWKPLWPYRGTEWRDWLLARDEGLKPALPPDGAP